MNVNLIVALDKHTFGIGYKGEIPWKNSNDMKWFKEVTTGAGNNAVVMGRTTYESIGKPLPNRTNYVLTRSNNEIEGCIVVHSLDEAINHAKQEKKDSLFIIGGSSVYDEAISRNIPDIIYMDLIDAGVSHVHLDRYFNHIQTIYKNYALSQRLTGKYVGIPDTDIQVLYKLNTTSCVDASYLNLMDDILKYGKTKHTRAGDTLSVFGKTLSFDLREGLPILTTKKVYAKGCIHELLWILQGNTNIKYLVENNTHIWDDDAYRYYIQMFEKDMNVEDRTSKESFIQSVLNQETRTYVNNNVSEIYTYGDLGPVYGKQWVDWNGVNQVNELIHKLKTNPDDRRLMISAWNVGEIKDMALPPCHYLSQWYVTEMTFDERIDEYNKRYPNDEVPDNDTDLDNAGIPRQYLSCMWMQRSVDTCLGLPYDLLSYSILTHLIAQVCNMVPYEIKCSLGDTHIYKNQIPGAITQLNRNPYKYERATLKLTPNIKNIYDFKYDDIKIENYQSYSAIKYPLSVGL